MINIKQQLDTVLTKEMDRKNFLQYGGTIILTLLGITGLIRLLLSGGDKGSSLQSTTQNTPGNGYGSSRYGQ